MRRRTIDIRSLLLVALCEVCGEEEVFSFDILALQLLCDILSTPSQIDVIMLDAGRVRILLAS